MFLKIFIPKEFYSLKLTEVLFGDSISNKDTSSIFITNKSGFGEPIGEINPENQISVVPANKSVYINFSYNQSDDNLTIAALKYNEANITNVQLFIYDYDAINCLSKNYDSWEHYEQNDIVNLAQLINKTKSDIDQRTKIIKTVKTMKCFIIFIQLLNLIVKPLSLIFRDTAVSYHFSDWSKCVKKYDFKSGRAWTIIFDVMAGLVILIWLLWLGNPGEYLMKFTKLVVDNLRNLLESLKGNPVGLKLNVQLNNFLLSCFIYHVELWNTFLFIVSPAINYLFIPLGVLGFFGLSFQLAMLSDLLVLISLHAHCFYVYAAVLYNIEIVGMQALWRVVLGRRKNVLKERVESYSYINRQLYLATMFFASLIFLLPTVLVYYVVFAALRFGVYCIIYILMKIRRKILVFPINTYYRVIFKNYVNADNFHFEFIGTKPDLNSVQIRTSLFSIKAQKSGLWKNKLSDIPCDSNDEKLITIGKFICGLVRGDMMGFIQPKIKFN